MRYEEGHKEATRQHIISVAAKLFRKSGIAATGLAGIMAEAGLTNGAFYAHFKSKEDLVREVLIYSLEIFSTDFWLKVGDDSAKLETAICAYLGPRHRDKPEQGCPTAALVAEVARESKATRNAFTESFKEQVNAIVKGLNGKSSQVIRQDVLAVHGLLVGSLQIARAVTDEKLSNEILQSGIDTALKILHKMS